jgi:hypothetical protein
MKVQQLPKTVGGTVKVPDALAPKVGEEVEGGGHAEAWVHSVNGKEWSVVSGPHKNYIKTQKETK